MSSLREAARAGTLEAMLASYVEETCAGMDDVKKLIAMFEFIAGALAVLEVVSVAAVERGIPAEFACRELAKEGLQIFARLNPNNFRRPDAGSESKTAGEEDAEDGRVIAMWEGYRERVLSNMPVPMTAEQIQAARLIFYSGAKAVLVLVEVARSSGAIDDPGTFLASLEIEIREALER